MQTKNFRFAVSNPTKCIANLRTQPMHFKMNLEIYKTSFVMKEVVYKISKSLLGIKFNVKKSVLLNYMCKKDKSEIEFINHLSLNAFKLKLGCLLNKL